MMSIIDNFVDFYAFLKLFKTCIFYTCVNMLRFYVKNNYRILLRSIESNHDIQTKSSDEKISNFYFNPFIITFYDNLYIFLNKNYLIKKSYANKRGN